MTSNRFYIEKKNIRSGSVLLEGKEHHHLSRVARLKTQDNVWLFDEEGATYVARIEKIGKDSTALVILSRDKKKIPQTRLILAQAVLKSKKMDFLIQKGTELGMTDFIPVLSKRAFGGICERFESKRTRWDKISIEALKQCGRSNQPKIHDPVNLSDLLKERKETLKIFLSENQGLPFKEIFRSSDQKSEISIDSIIILCGPEGGWTEEEELYILESGFTCVSLGRFILRAETAALSSLAVTQQFWDL